MTNLYKKSEIRFAVVIIIAYVVGTSVADGLSDALGVAKSLPLFLQPTVYINGKYNQVKEETEEMEYSTRTIESPSTASGMLASFMESRQLDLLRRRKDPE